MNINQHGLKDLMKNILYQKGHVIKEYLEKWQFL